MLRHRVKGHMEHYLSSSEGELVHPSLDAFYFCSYQDRRARIDRSGYVWKTLLSPASSQRQEFVPTT